MVSAEFRLPKAIVANEVKKLEAMGVHDHDRHGHRPRSLSIDELFEEMGFKGRVRRLRCRPAHVHSTSRARRSGRYVRQRVPDPYQPHEGQSATRATTPVHPFSNAVAAASAAATLPWMPRSCAKRLGAEQVYIVYRRGDAEMPARLGELHHAKEEGHRAARPVQPTKILDDGPIGRVGAIGNASAWSSVSRMPPAAPFRFAIEGSEFQALPSAPFIMALGTSPNPLIRSTDAPGPRDEQEGLPRCQRGLT